MRSFRTRRGSRSRLGQRSARATGSRGSGGRASSRSALAAPASGSPAGPPAAGRGRRVLGAPQRWGVGGAPPPRLRRLSALSFPAFSPESLANAAAPFPPRAGPTRSAAEAASGPFPGVRAARPFRPRLAVNPAWIRAHPRRLPRAPLCLRGPRGVASSPSFPRQPRLAARCCRKWPERRRAAADASDRRPTPPGEGSGLLLPRLRAPGQKPSPWFSC